MKEEKTITRSYTLRLKGTDPKDHSWQSILWKTHEALNNGVKVFADILLTCQGALDLSLADAILEDGKKPTREDIRNRRILQTISLLRVESRSGAPKKYIVATGKDSPNLRNLKVEISFRRILRRKGLSNAQISEWREDCLPYLTADINKDAVWVDRSRASEEMATVVGHPITSQEAWDILSYFFESYEKYFAMTVDSANDITGRGGAKKKAYVQPSINLLSNHFGTGKKADFKKVYLNLTKIAERADKAKGGISGQKFMKDLAINLLGGVTSSKVLSKVNNQITYPGDRKNIRNLLKQIALNNCVTRQDLKKLRDLALATANKLSKKFGLKKQLPHANAFLSLVEKVCGLTYRTDTHGNKVSALNYCKYPDGYKWGKDNREFFVVMLDHAARRVFQNYTLIKKAEAKRRKYEEEAKKIANVPENTRKWLDDFCSRRSQELGAKKPYYIGTRALGGWEEVVAAWSEDTCRTPEDRISAVRKLQGNLVIEKFGDAQLFEALADDDALRVWHRDGNPNGEPDPHPLIDYAIASKAENKMRHYKVPMYRHPDPLYHPVFCDFGQSRMQIKYNIQKGAHSLSPRRVSLALLTGSKISFVEFRWQSKRLARDLALGKV